MATATVVLVAGVAAVAGADPAVSEDEPLLAAGRAAQHESFVGTLRVQWSEAGAVRSETLLVQGANGAVEVRGGSAVMASPQQRLVEHGDQWNLLWPVPLGGRPRPQASRKYELVAGSTTSVAGRTSQVIEVHGQGVLLERLYLDAETNLLLRREQFERGSRPVRSIGFDSVTIGATSTGPRRPAKVVDAVPRLLAVGELPRRVAAPENLPGEYQRLGVYSRSGVVQVLYSDGLYDLSVFQQPGRLDRGDLPPGDRLALGKKSAWHYVWPGGHLVVWESGGVVHTAVSDAPLDQVVSAVRALPAPHASSSLLQRLRRVCRALVQPLAD